MALSFGRASRGEPIRGMAFEDCGQGLVGVRLGRVTGLVSVVAQALGGVLPCGPIVYDFSFFLYIFEEIFF